MKANWWLSQTVPATQEWVKLCVSEDGRVEVLREGGARQAFASEEEAALTLLEQEFRPLAHLTLSGEPKAPLRPPVWP